MSLINKMLQDLDRRQGGADVADATPRSTVRAVQPAEQRREWFWRIVAGLMLIAVGWVVWIAYQLRPHPVVTDLAFRAAEEARRSRAGAQLPSVPAPVIAAPAAADSQLAPQSFETFRLATAIESPIREPEQPRPRVGSAAPAKPGAVKPSVAPAPASAVGAAPSANVPKPVESVQVRAGAAARTAPEAPAARPAANPGRVEKRDIAKSTFERAEQEFRRAIGALNQGHSADAESALLRAIGIDPSHVPARQALIALMLEQKRVDVARRLLQDGLALNPAQAQFALVLARILIDSRDHANALAVLAGASGPGATNAEYMAMLGTVHQRLGMHREAAEAFRAAVRLAPATGTAWLGLGISLEALDRRAEAVEAYRQAATSGVLQAELRAYAEGRVRQIKQ